MKLKLITIVGIFTALLSNAFGAGFRAEGPTVHINEMSVFTLKVTLNGKSPSQRAEAIVDTISTGELRLPVVITKSAKELWLKSGAMSIVRVTPQEAKAFNMTQQELMNDWKLKVETAMNLPPVVFPQSKFQIVEGSSSLVRIIGSEALLITPRSSKKDVFTAEIALGGVMIKGLKPGNGVLEIECPSGVYSYPIEISGKPSISQTRFNTTVVGAPASAFEVEKAVRDVVSETLITEPGTSVRFVNIDALTIKAKESKEISAKIRITAPGFAPYDFDIVILVKNEGYRIPKEKEFWYSNKPETYRQSGTLFNALLKQGTPVRMLYHHRNGTNSPSVLRVMLYNNSDQPAKVAVLMGDGTPDEDPVKTGTDAGEIFMRNQIDGTYDFIEIPAKSRVPISARMLEENNCMSGIVTMNLVDGSCDEITVRTEALPSLSQSAFWESKVDSVTSTKKFVSRPITQALNPMPPSIYIYQAPFRDLNVEYQAGGKKLGVVRVGQTPIASLIGTQLLEGNYGVTYTVIAKIENQLAKSQTMQIAFEASAGYLGGVFVIDGKVVRPTVLQTKEERILATIKLAPNERKSMKIMTIPLGGSSYPATMTFREEGTPQSATKPPRIGETK